MIVFVVVANGDDKKIIHLDYRFAECHKPSSGAIRAKNAIRLLRMIYHSIKNRFDEKIALFLNMESEFMFCQILK